MFGRTLDETTNSYKFFWLQALLSAVRSQSALEVPISELLDEMVIAAWHPVTLYKLSLGQTDKLQHIVMHLLSTSGLRPSATSAEIKNAIIHNSLTTELAKLGRYVPFRFLAPWFDRELRRVSDHYRNIEIQKLAVQKLGGPYGPPYCIETSDGSQKIRFDPRWHSWMRENVTVLRGFADQSLMQFLQARNPNVPAIPSKLRSPGHRKLERGRKFWTETVKETSCKYPRQTVRDIYTGAEIASEFSVDHFLPWTFVGHDLLWNLVPVTGLTNSSKGDAVPNLSRYLPDLAAVHHIAVQSLREHPELLEDHIEFFGQDMSSLVHCSLELLAKQFEIRLRPMAELAKLQGFRTEWTA